MFLKHYSKEEFKEKVEYTDWSDFYLCRSVNQAWDSFRKWFHSILSSVAPHKDIIIKENSEPWMTSEMENVTLTYYRIKNQEVNIYIWTSVDTEMCCPKGKCGCQYLSIMDFLRGQYNPNRSIYNILTE